MLFDGRPDEQPGKLQNSKKRTRIHWSRLNQLKEGFPSVSSKKKTEKKKSGSRRLTLHNFTLKNTV